MGFVNAGRRLASTFGSRSWWSSSSHPPRFIRVTTQSESVMRSHPVGWLAWNSGTSLAKNSWLSLMISRYVTSMSYLDWKASSVGRWPPFARSIYSGHWATVSWWPRGGSVLGAAAGACLPAHAAERGRGHPHPSPPGASKKLPARERSIHPFPRAVRHLSPLVIPRRTFGVSCHSVGRNRVRGDQGSSGSSNTNHPSTETAGTDASGEPAGGAVGSTTNSRSPGGTELRSVARDAASLPARPRPAHREANAT